MPAVLFCAVVSAVGLRSVSPDFLSSISAGFSVACAVLAIAFSVVGFFSGSAFPGSYCSSSYGAAKPFSSLGPFSSSSIGDPVLSPMVDCEHLLLYLSGTDRASQETAI